LWLAEVITSFFCWSGIPFDVAPDPRFNFWYLEVWRLQYWSICFFGAYLAWLIIRWCVEGRGGHGEINARYSLKRISLWLIAIALAIAAEVGTSIWYQRRLPWILSFGMYATDLRLYLRQHLIWWGVFLLVGVVPGKLPGAQTV
jgi:hypothetical protein